MVPGVGDMVLMGAEGSSLAGSTGRVVLGSGEVLRRTGGGVAFEVIKGVAFAVSESRSVLEMAILQARSCGMSAVASW